MEIKTIFKKYILYFILFFLQLSVSCEQCEKYGEVFESTCLVELKLKASGDKGISQINVFELDDYNISYNEDNAIDNDSLFNELIAIFKNKPEVEDDKIINKNDILLIWHSGYESMYPSSGFTKNNINLSYFHNYDSKLSLEQELKNYEDESPQLDLREFRAGSYYLAAWAWDEYGILYYSSKIKKFTVSLGY